MANEVSELFAQFSYIIAICPNDECGQLLRLSDARPYLKDRRPHSVLDDIEAETDRIDRAIDRLEEQEAFLRAEAREAGLREAKRRLKKIDLVFSGSRLDPQDVKVIFDPVEYVVFDGMSRERLRRVLLLSHQPSTSDGERIFTSLQHTIQAGNVEFRTLRILEDGSMQLT